jgi:cysteine desulfuration protein SufE
MAAMTYPQRLRRLLDSWQQLSDQNQRIEALVAYAQRYPSLESQSGESLPGAENLVPGCESQVYVWSEPSHNNRRRLRFRVNNPSGISSMALAVLLEETLSEEDPEAVRSVDEEFVYDLFGRELSMGKGMGLLNMVRMAKKELLRAADEGR